jgi:hypothetical protein
MYLATVPPPPLSILPSSPVSRAHVPYRRAAHLAQYSAGASLVEYLPPSGVFGYHMP